VFDVAPQELLLLGAVAVLVIPPKDLPRAMRFAGQWIGKARGMARHFRSGVDEMIRQAELDEIEKKWREENERIMREHPLHDAIEHPAEPVPLPAPESDHSTDMIVEPAPAEALAETGPLTAENGTELPPPIPEGNPPPVTDLPTESATEPAPKRARMPKPTASAEDGPELPFDLPPKS